MRLEMIIEDFPSALESHLRQLHIHFPVLAASVEACVECARLTCLLTSAPACRSHRRHSGCPPNAAMCVGVCAKREVTAFTPQPT